MQILEEDVLLVQEGNYLSVREQCSACARKYGPLVWENRFLVQEAPLLVQEEENTDSIIKVAQDRPKWPEIARLGFRILGFGFRV